MMKHVLKLTIIGMLLLCQLSTAHGQELEPPLPSRTLEIGTKHSPPFAFKNNDGNWTGISIELWKHLADELNLEYEFREQTLDQMLNGLEAGQLDAAVAAITVTAERDQRVEFCHSHYTTGLGIAVSGKRQASSWTLLRRIVSSRLLAVIGAMAGIVIVCGWLFWLFERKKNSTMFGKRRQGIGMGMWWSMTLLLGHKGVVPVSIWGRIIAASAMFISILIVSVLTGIVASFLTVQQLDTGIEDPSDLRKVRVVTVESSTSADYLRLRRIAFQTRATAELALQAVVDGKADAVVYDQALLKYSVGNDYAENLHVLPVSFNMQNYAIALPLESPLRKPLNTDLLRYQASDEWDAMLYRYLGE